MGSRQSGSARTRVCKEKDCKVIASVGDGKANRTMRSPESSRSSKSLPRPLGGQSEGVPVAGSPVGVGTTQWRPEGTGAEGTQTPLAEAQGREGRGKRPGFSICPPSTLPLDKASSPGGSPQGQERV